MNACKLCNLKLEAPLPTLAALNLLTFFPSTTMSDNPAHKRRRVQRPAMPSADEYKLDDDDPNYEPYIPIAQRRQAKLARLTELGVSTDQRRHKESEQAQQEEQEDAEREQEREKERLRREKTLLVEAQEVHQRKAAAGPYPPPHLIYSPN